MKILKKQGLEICNDLSLDACLITRGPNGMSYIGKDAKFHVSSEAKEIYDVSGAGDTVIASFAAGILAGFDSESVTRFANKAAGIVVGHIGTIVEIPQNEKTPFYPRSPYGVAKLYAYWIVVNYREAYNIFACNGILFNHESPRRGKTFLTRKVSQAACKISLGLQDVVYLGNLDAKRDWGYAPEYCEGMWKILQQDDPEDFVLATGKVASVREFVELAFRELNIVIRWEGSGLNEIGVDEKTNKTLIKIDKNYYRPAEVNMLQGDFSKASALLKWEPKINLEQLVKIMVRSDFDKIKSEVLNK